MDLETTVVLIGLVIAGLVGLIWGARRIDRQHAKSNDILQHSDAIQSRSDKQLDREAELLGRWEAVVTRLERIADQHENQKRN